MCLGKDLRISGWRKPCSVGIQNWQRTQVYSTGDFRYKWADKNIQLVHSLHGTDYLVRRAMADMGCVFLVLVLNKSILDFILTVGYMGSVLRSTGWMLQYWKGLPMYPTWHVHLGTWLITWQSAFWPQVPGQGSWHLFRMQARFDGQSEFRTHSGRQPSYGFPVYSGRQVHDPALFCCLQMALAPQGVGLQGSNRSIGYVWTIKYGCFCTNV